MVQPVAKATGCERTEPRFAGSNGLEPKTCPISPLLRQEWRVLRDLQAVQRFTTACYWTTDGGVVEGRAYTGKTKA